MKNAEKGVWDVLGIAMCLIMICGIRSFGQTKVLVRNEAAASREYEWNADDLGLEEVQEFLNQQTGGMGNKVSLLDYMKMLMKGNLSEVMRLTGNTIKETLFSEIQECSGKMGQVLALGIMGAVFANFATVFSSSQISETGYFMIYMLLFISLAANFMIGIQIAEEAIGLILEFMRVLLPSYFLAVMAAGGNASAAAVYGFTMWSIEAVQWFLNSIILPVIKVYLMLVLASHVTKEDMLSRLSEMLERGIGWGIKSAVGLVLGYHVVQGMVMPYVDFVKNAAARKAIGMIPGIGKGVEAIAETLLGSGVLIKNTIGAAGVIILLILAAVPMVKLLAMLILFQGMSALLQPICDKRIVAAVADTAKGQALLLKTVFASAFLFAMTVAVTCAATNAVY